MSDSNELHIDFKIEGKTLLKGDSADLETKHGGGIRRLHVDQRLDSPDYFSVELWSTEHADLNMVDSIKPGSAVEIEIGYGLEAPIFKGEISYLEPHFDSRDMYISVSGYDKSHRLTRGTSSRTWGDGHKDMQSPADVMSAVVSEAGAREGSGSDGLAVDKGSASSQLEYVAQYNQNDFQFLSQMIGSFGMTLDNKAYENDAKLSLKALEKGSAVCKICRDKFNASDAGDGDSQAISADFRLSTVRQVAKVEVRGWDPYKKVALKGEAKSLSSTIGGTAGKDQAGKAHYGSASAGRVVTIVDLPIRDDKEAEEIAQSILDKFGMDWMTADVVVEGRPDLHAGAVVEMNGYGKRWSGEYFVEQCQHVFIAGSGNTYRCYLKLARNASPEP